LVEISISGTTSRVNEDRLPHLGKVRDVAAEQRLRLGVPKRRREERSMRSIFSQLISLTDVGNLNASQLGRSRNLRGGFWRDNPIFP
jgi:hypothetical protein